MKRTLIALLLILAADTLALPQGRRPRNRGRRAAAERQAPPGNMAGVNVRGNTVRFNSEWELVKGAGDNTYARKKKAKNYVLAVSCRCSLQGGVASCSRRTTPPWNVEAASPAPAALAAS